MGENGEPRVTVVLPVFNARQNIGLLLDRLRGQEFPRDEWELVAVDNGSTDGTLEILNSQNHGWIRLVHETRRGPSAARNCGIRHARGSIVAFIDSDCVPRHDWLSRLIAGFDDRTNWAVGGLLASAPPTTLTETFTARQGILNQEDFFKPLDFKPPFLLTANFAVRRAVFDRVGVFDEQLRVGEDADFCWRILKAGGKLHLVRSAIVEHRHRSDIGSFARQMYEYGIGSAATFARHREFIERQIWVDFRSYRFLMKGFVKMLLYPLVRRDSYLRREGTLEVVRYTCFMAGRLVGSIRNRVIVV
jgi:GT2 family glycosyltransferase